MNFLCSIAFGCNVGDRASTLWVARQKVAALGTDLRESSVFESDPMYLADQPTFWNGVWQLRTELGPNRLLHELMRIETEGGRTRTIRNGPRTLDLDLLTYGRLSYRFLKCGDEILTVPHPRMHERSFVMEPLAELAGQPVEGVCRRLGMLQELLRTSENFSTS